MDHDLFLVPPDTTISLDAYDPGYTGEFATKKDAERKLKDDIKRLAALQDILYADDSFAVLIIFQAIDAAGKDSAIKHVMSGVNPQGCQVFSFKTPSAEELDHDYMWRCLRALPERGRIGIFNRSYYEEVLVVRVHPSFLDNQRLPPSTVDEDLWKRRYKQINDIERYLTQNGIVILKFFLNVSKEEQKERFLERIDRPEKNWKFSANDVRERAHWEAYMHAYEQALSHTSTEWAPWYVIPADHKWLSRAAIADILVSRLEALNLSYPQVSDEDRAELLKAREELVQES